MQIGYEAAEFVLSQPETIEIAEDPFLRVRADSGVGYRCLTVPKHVLLEQLRRFFSCISLSVIPLIVRNGVGMKKSGLRELPVR